LFSTFVTVARLATVIAASILTASCTSEQVATGPNVVARWKTCSGSTGPGSHTALEGTNWSGERLIVDVKDIDYCDGTSISDLSYAVVGDTVQLHWAWKIAPDNALTACECFHSIRFELSQLAVREYKVSLLKGK